ncbi:MAG: lytic transglycosylase domain-containing protein [Gemmatimonadota bacterium]
MPIRDPRDWLRARRGPASRLIIGTALIAPAAAFMSVSAPPAGDTVDYSEDTVSRFWSERVLERQRQGLALEYAATFQIPLDLAFQVHDAAVAEDIEPHVAFGLVRAESSFRRTAVSYAGAVGLTQLLPSTARWLVPGTTRSALFEPKTNLQVGFKYLRYLMDKYQGDERLALTAYNRGPGTVDGLLKRGRNPDNGYADMVLTGESKRHVALMRSRGTE